MIPRLNVTQFVMWALKDLPRRNLRLCTCHDQFSKCGCVMDSLDAVCHYCMTDT